jgi:hypothetical protein
MDIVLKRYGDTAIREQIRVAYIHLCIYIYMECFVVERILG